MAAYALITEIMLLPSFFNVPAGHDGFFHGLNANVSCNNLN